MAVLMSGTTSIMLEPLAGNTVLLKRMGIDTHEEPIVYIGGILSGRPLAHWPVTTASAALLVPYPEFDDSPSYNPSGSA